MIRSRAQTLLLLLSTLAPMAGECARAAAPSSSVTGQGLVAAPLARPIGPIEPTNPIDPTDPTDPTGPTLPSGNWMCAVDLNGNGDAADEGETASCVGTTSGTWACPIQQVACASPAPGVYACPLGDQYACTAPISGGPPVCSPNSCINETTNPIVDEPVVDDPGVPNDGTVDADGNCTANIEIFSGRALRCRPPGLKDTFQNCCKDKGEIVHDGMGSSIMSLSTKITVAKNVFTGMKAAYTAYTAGATASEAASAGAHAIVVGIDPTSIAISLAIDFMIEVLLQGCDSQDMETGMLRGSGMCHEIGEYCSSKILGICIQKAKGHCCFNTKLGRIIQEQGRPQLKSFNGIGWGTPKSPMCRGFTPDEFQALDFSKIDLSEYYSDIEARGQSDIQIDMKDKIDAYSQTIPH
jgi:conjugal transfer mating pair stabilization protein TraN